MIRLILAQLPVNVVGGEQELAEVLGRKRGYGYGGRREEGGGGMTGEEAEVGRFRQ